MIDEDEICKCIFQLTLTSHRSCDTSHFIIISVLSENHTRVYTECMNPDDIDTDFEVHFDIY